MRIARLLTLVAVAAALAACRTPPPMAPNAMLVEQGMSQPPAGAGATARWLGVGHAAAGSVRMSVENGVARLDFSSDFSVSAVPGPFVYVNTTNNANTGRPLRISALRSNAGAQSYTFQLPAGVAYSWVLIWCDPFNVPVAQASIQSTP